ncbi:hypothetical protein CW304_30900 [Bacillus sp. UFRGS-B20]|nr:hypothetical protein CW304_30900 [Bacillus sp. UFRGS-B20]
MIMLTKGSWVVGEWIDKTKTSVQIAVLFRGGGINYNYRKVKGIKVSKNSKALYFEIVYI